MVRIFKPQLFADIAFERFECQQTWSNSEALQRGKLPKFLFEPKNREINKLKLKIEPTLSVNRDVL